MHKFMKCAGKCSKIFNCNVKPLLRKSLLALESSALKTFALKCPFFKKLSEPPFKSSTASKSSHLSIIKIPYGKFQERIPGNRSGVGNTVINHGTTPERLPAGACAAGANEWRIKRDFPD